MATTLEQPITLQNSLPVRFYPPLLSESDLSHLDMWAERCMGAPSPAPRLAAYLACVAEFERERRATLDAGYKIQEAFLVPLSCPSWENREVAHALGKLAAISHVSSGELKELFGALEAVIVAECQHRLDPHGPMEQELI